MDLDNRNIVAIGGLISDEQSHQLFSTMLKLVSSPCPRISFLATAKGDSQDFIDRFYATFKTLPCVPTHLPLFERTPDVEIHLRNQDIILVGGGNTRSMLAVWQTWGMLELLHQAWQRGTMLAGWSAGAICWFEAGLTDSRAACYDPIQGLGLLPGSCCPHYGDNARSQAFREYIATARLPSGVGIPDGVGVHYRGTRVAGVLNVGHSPDAQQVTLLDGSLEIAPLRVGA